MNQFYQSTGTKSEPKKGRTETQQKMSTMSQIKSKIEHSRKEQVDLNQDPCLAQMMP